MKKFRVVVIGAGTIAITHLKTLQQSERSLVVALADINQQRAEEIAAAFHIKPYTDYRLMVIETQPDIVIIALPHFLHKEVVIWCAGQGCHVLVEKPMAMDRYESDEMIEAAKINNVVLAVGHMQHYFSANVKAKEIIGSGKLGELVMIHDRRHGHYFHPERPDWFLNKAHSGGGIVINLGSHSIDRIQWLTNSRITAVKAHMTFMSERGDVEGSGHLFMHTSRGATATVTLGGYRNLLVNEMELFFTEGQLKIEGNHGLYISTNNQPYETVDTSELPNAFTAQWNHLLDGIEYGKDLDISGIYGRSVVAVIDAAYRAYETGVEQEVVHSLVESCG